MEVYEAMRRGSEREGSRRAGYEVLRRQGLAAWIRAFSGCLSAVEPEASPLPAVPAPSPGASTPRPPCAGDRWGVPMSLYPELTGLLAGLALSRLEEGVC